MLLQAPEAAVAQAVELAAVADSVQGQGGLLLSSHVATVQSVLGGAPYKLVDCFIFFFCGRRPKLKVPGTQWEDACPPMCEGHPREPLPME